MNACIEAIICIVPAPIVGAGLPGVLAAIAAVVWWWRR